MTKRIDVLVIGGGPGGYPAAIRSAQLGKSVLLVEKAIIGGECLNWGCIPSKALIEAADFYHDMINDAPVMGISVQDVNVDMKKLQKWKIHVQEHLINGIKQLLRGNKVETLMGTARFLGPNKVEVALLDGKKVDVEADDVVIAIGSRFRTLEDIKVDENKILSVKGALSLSHLPEDMVFIGGGFAGLELGIVYAKLGSKVRIVELQSQLLPGVDSRLVGVVSRNLKKLGVKAYLESQVERIDHKTSGKMDVIITNKNGITLNLAADKVVVSVGKVPLFDEIGLGSAGIKTSKGWIIVDSRQQTNVPHHYGVGDCTGPPFLAHRASKHGVIAAEVIAGLESKAEFRAMPGVIFTDPEIAFAGLTETEAKKAGYDIYTGVAPFTASGRALTKLETKGFVKAVVEKGTGCILGIQIVGPNASDLISEVALAIEMEASAQDVAFTVHPHPTLPEMIMEAVEVVQGKAIHVMKQKRTD